MRKALVIGNSEYGSPNYNLKNPLNDALIIGGILEYKGFDVTSYFNLINSDFIEKFDSFCSEINKEDDVIFFFAGHAIEDRDVNYLLSVDFHISGANSSISLDMIQNKLCNVNNTGLKLIIVDACRDNRGLLEAPPQKKVKVNNNVLIAYSTSSGNTAKDGKLENSLYAKFLVENIKKYNITITEIFSKTREEVIQGTNFSQVPWEYSSLIESANFSFDNIDIPRKLKRIIKSRFSQSYGIKNIDDLFIAIGDYKKINFFSVLSSTVNNLNLKLHDEFNCIESIDLNREFIAFSTDNNSVYIYRFNGELTEKIQLADPVTTVLLKNNIVFFTGIMDKIHTFNIKDKTRNSIDVKEEVLRGLVDDEVSLNHITQTFTIMSLASSEDNIIAFGGSDSVFCVKNIQDDKYLFVNKKHDFFSYTYSICFSDDGKYIATGHEGGKCVLWDAKNYHILNIFKTNEYIIKNQFFEFVEEQHSNHILCVKFLPGSKALAVATSESSVIFYDVTHMEIIHEIDLNIEPFPIYGMEFDSQGDHLVVAMKDKNYIFSR